MKGKIAQEELLKRIGIFINQIKDSNTVVALLLFGSYASGRETAISDVDVAVLLDCSVDKELFMQERLRLMVELSSFLETDHFDLVILNEASPALAYRVIRDGQLLFERNDARGQLVRFKVKMLDRYFDYQPVERIFSQALIKRIKGGSFGGR
jgi:uncharacterized protein